MSGMIHTHWSHTYIHSECSSVIQKRGTKSKKKKKMREIVLPCSIIFTQQLMSWKVVRVYSFPSTFLQPIEKSSVLISSPKSVVFFSLFCCWWWFFICLFVCFLMTHLETPRRTQYGYLSPFQGQY